MICRKCLVSGRVQGVYYRGSTRKQAHVLGVVGYAHNLLDGRVEVLMCGESTAVESLQNWLWLGPQYAEVKDVICETVATDNQPEGFDIG